MEAKEDKEEIKTINIFPCKNSRRILTFLADFFICFIISIFLFEIIIRPSSFAIINYDNLTKQYVDANTNTISLLFKGKILYCNEITADNFTDSIKYTCDIFTKEFCEKSEGREYDVFEEYLINFKKENIDALLDLYKENGSEYFDVNYEKQNISMKQEYINLFSPKFNPKDEISESGKKAYEKYQEEFFLNSYSTVILKDIKENDFYLEEYPELGTFLSNDEIIQQFDQKIKTTLKIDASLSFLIAIIIYYLIVPLCNKKGQTCGEIILKIERIDIRNLQYLKKRFVLTQGLLNGLTNTTMILFIPAITLGFGPVFALTELLSISIVGFCFIIVELLIMIFTKMNQSLKELATHSICVDTDTMDEYYREKGYDF